MKHWETNIYFKPGGEVDQCFTNYQLARAW